MNDEMEDAPYILRAMMTGNNTMWREREETNASFMDAEQQKGASKRDVTKENDRS